MGKIILYGAGARGKKVASLLMKNDILIAGFCDSSKREQNIEVGGDKFPVYSVEQLVENGEDYSIVVTIADNREIRKIEEELKILKLNVTTVERILGKKADSVIRNREYVAEYHIEEMEDYYQEAESETNMQIFWGNESEFKRMFSLLDLDNVTELACGHGRHVPKYIDIANKIMLVDILDKNISYCKKRFGQNLKIKYYVNNGHDLKKLVSNSYSALFTYDAMVHFEMMDIYEYLKETYRILKHGGRALFHHSNNTEDYKITFSTGTAGRNFMSSQIFAYLANRAELNVLDQKIIDWEGKKGLDCLTLVEKK